jgi:hypothetical protein
MSLAMLYMECQYGLSNFVRNIRLLGFCGVTKSDYGKLVLTRSIGLIRLPLSDGWNNTDWISAKIKESSNFQEGIATMRQLSFGMLDMGWHAQDPSNIKEIKALK